MKPIPFSLERNQLCFALPKQPLGIRIARKSTCCDRIYFASAALISPTPAVTLVISVPISNVPVFRNVIAVKVRLDTIVRIPMIVVFIWKEYYLLAS
jgi:hypothetical protein